MVPVPCIGSFIPAWAAAVQVALFTPSEKPSSCVFAPALCYAACLAEVRFGICGAHRVTR